MDGRMEPSRAAKSLGGDFPSADVNVKYRLNIRQQPVAARSCGFGERDRRVIDPPPIVELLIEGPKIGRAHV